MKSSNLIRIKFFLFLLLLCSTQFSFAQNTNVEQDSNQTNKESEHANSISVPNILFSGVLLRNAEKSQVWYLPNAFEWFPANTVEGFVFNPQVKFTKKLKKGRFYSITPNIRYGFGNKRFQAQVKTNYFYSPKVNGLLSVSGGRAIEQLYHESTLSALNNTLSTFAFNENFLKIYERSYAQVGHTISPVNAFLFTAKFSYNDRNPLNNLQRFEEDEEFLSNTPQNLELENTAFTQHTAVLLESELRWQIGHRLTKEKGELISEGKYPAITISYTNALNNILGGDVSYQKLALSLQDEFKVGSGSGQGFIQVGDFLSKDNLTFLDFNHFKGEETVYSPYDNDQFHLLEYYTNSTAEFFVQGHYEHNFGTLFTRGKSSFKPVAGIKYLYTNAGGHYTELGVGLDEVFNFYRFDFYNSWRDGEHESFGVRLGLVFD